MHIDQRRTRREEEPLEVKSLHRRYKLLLVELAITFAIGSLCEAHLLQNF